MEHSKFYRLTAAEAADLHLKRIDLARIITVCCEMLVLVSILVVLIRYRLSGGAYGISIRTTILQMFIAFCVDYFYKLYCNITFQGMGIILRKDCDPVKYYRVLEILSVADRRGRGVSTFNMAFANAAYAMGDYTLAEEHLRKVHFKKWMADRELPLLNQWGNLYYATNRRQDYERCVGHIAWLRQNKRLGKKEKEYLNRLERLWECNQALDTGDAGRVRELIAQELDRPYVQPIQRVNCYFKLGKLELAQGNTEEAYYMLRYVQENGNTLAIRKKAEELLSGLEITKK